MNKLQDLKKKNCICLSKCFIYENTTWIWR